MILRHMFNPLCPNTVNSLYSGHRRDLKLVSSLARVRNSGNLFQSNVCNLFFPGIYSCCPFYWGVRYSEVSARRELTVSTYQFSTLISIRFLKIQLREFDKRSKHFLIVGHSRDFRIVLASTRKPYWIWLLFTLKNSDFGAVSGRLTANL